MNEEVDFDEILEEFRRNGTGYIYTSLLGLPF